MTETITNLSRIKRMIEIVVPYDGKEITFAHPSIGPDNYVDIGEEILKQGMKVPTGDYMASLLHAAYCDDSVKNEPEFQNIRQIMEERGRGLWVFNRNIWTKDGVYVVPDLKALGRNQPLSQNELEKMLKGSKDINGIRFSEDQGVRFAPKGSYESGFHTPELLAKNGFVIASYGIEGAEKLGEVSSKFKNRPYVYGVETDTAEQRVSSLVAVGCGNWLGVCGSHFVDDGDYHAFGIKKIK